MRKINFLQNEDGSKNYYRFGRIYMTRVPGCCSAGILHAAHIGYPTTQVPSITRNSNTTPIEWASHSSMSYDGSMACLAAMFAYRVLNSAHPYEKLRLNSCAAYKPKAEPGSYRWPSKVWNMHDRTDVSYAQTYKSSHTIGFGRWMESYATEMGIRTVVVNGPSVHGKGSTYNSFGSAKPEGYGTLRCWTFVVEDVDKLQEWYDNLNMMIAEQSIRGAQAADFKVKVA